MTTRRRRWLRRWLLVVACWAIPVATVAVREVRDESAYNRADLQRELRSWQFSDAQQAAGVAARCRGTPEAARTAGCPDAVLDANAPRQREAEAEYALRQRTLAVYLLHALIGYWAAPAALLFAFGAAIGLLRRALRHAPVPPVDPPAAA
ncbi:hypothetical protein [Burkholderia plantarii]|uniref:hypothetical protein n=1 Tax=Burkholderia plantarii TaxID=41899 RepID=UPI0006D8A85A|nr:hypothetical protein [Burkholderia plantarii]ALK30990.1 hypothetical protein bpln_1g22190 [Burkholderia plantarii]GLZ17387.1 hypothetical protein Bpla01_09170 [Burkholderia plantarii]